MSCSHCSPTSGPHSIALSGTAGIKDESGEPTILLAGNPNVGKSTLFNMITGSRQAVVNAPGTTVEVAVGRSVRGGARIVDMPGTYSLVAQSPDEKVVVDTLAGVAGSFTDPASGRSVDLVVCVLDATALTRSLYLLAQVARTGRPIVAMVTLTDVAEAEGEHISIEALEKTLGVPVMAVDSRNSRQRDEVEDFLARGLQLRPRVRGVQPQPTAPGYNQVAAAAALATQNCSTPAHLVGQVSCHCQETGVCAHAAVDSTSALRSGQLIDEAEELFDWVDGVEKELGHLVLDQPRMSRSDRIDRVLLNPWLGLPIFFALMWLLFKIAGEWVAPVMDLFDGLFTSDVPGTASLTNLTNSLLTSIGWEQTWVQGFLVGGLLTGLGVVASFVPLMFIIFLMISLLEDSGYMARAAFLGDRLMRKIGLDGRVIMPLIMGFGCNLPSLAAVRSLPNARQRIVTVLITPYTSCAARLTIYLMIARIFFPENTGTVIFGLYMLSIAMVVLGALALRPIFTKNQTEAPLMLVLPPYGVPRILSTVHKTWLRSWSFVKGAGKIIVVMTMVVWLLASIPTASGYGFADPEMPMEDSAYGATAQMLVPVFKPAGFGEWHMTGALMTGFVAKETVISSIVVSYNMDVQDAGDAEEGGEDLGALPALVTGSFEKAAGSAAPLGALAFLIFVLTYTPCLATVAEQVRQIGGRLTVAAVGVQLVVAWLLSVGFFQIGRLFL
ncbi:ferrous iron transport protein B [Actinomyces minihominis]|uniref:ferrous iron transport protein B n=1 Tax=Actinomyces minihominis TaxID=2002838 RepID=UPI001F5CB296|nr:ferrous iron transport protein B [Actinomyces minihominis]